MKYNCQIGGVKPSIPKRNSVYGMKLLPNARYNARYNVKASVSHPDIE